MIGAGTEFPETSVGESAKARFTRDVWRGLSSRPKAIPPKWLYDESGSKLYEAITELPEYYPCRTETQILESQASEIAAALGPDAVVIEPGAGSGKKTEILLGALARPAGYVPVDIAEEALLAGAARMARRFPALLVCPVVADFTDRLSFPRMEMEASRRIAFFPGSTIGNLDPPDAIGFLKTLAADVGMGGALLIGVDHPKDRDILLAAYDDAAGVTAAFDLNLLHRMNRELLADFRPKRFRHESRFDADRQRVEMHLVSRTNQRVSVGGRIFTFEEDESIHTESAYKWEPSTFDRLAGHAGFSLERAWYDERGWFSVRLYSVGE